LKRLVCFFNEFIDGDKLFAGGKGGTLAHLYQKGYPVFDGFIIMPAAFENDELVPEAWANYPGAPRGWSFVKLSIIKLK